MEYSTVFCDWHAEPMIVVRSETTHQHWKDHADAEFQKNMQNFGLFILNDRTRLIGTGKRPSTKKSQGSQIIKLPQAH